MSGVGSGVPPPSEFEVPSVRPCLFYVSMIGITPCTVPQGAEEGGEGVATSVLSEMFQSPVVEGTISQLSVGCTCFKSILIVARDCGGASSFVTCEILDSLLLATVASLLSSATSYSLGVSAIIQMLAVLCI